MKLKTLIYLLICSLSFPFNGSSQDIYYVSPNSGEGSDLNSGETPQDPFATITHALTQLNPSTGGIIRLMPGDFYEQVYIENYSNLVIEPEGSGPVTLHGSYKGLAENNQAEGWNWELVDPNDDPYITAAYFKDNLIYKTIIPGSDSTNSSNKNIVNITIDHVFNWMFRVLPNGETQQLYGYFDMDMLSDRFDNCNTGGVNGGTYTGMYFSSRLAEERKGVGYIIREEDCNDPSNNNKVLYVAVDPADDFLNPNEPQLNHGLHYAKTGAIIRMRNCRDSRIDGSADKLITIKHSSRHTLYVDGNDDVENLYFQNLNFVDVREGITLLTIHPLNIVIRNNTFTHVVDDGYDYPARDVKANVIESSAIINTNEYFVSDDPVMNQRDNCIIENNRITGYFNGIAIIQVRRPDQTFPFNGFTTVRNNHLEEIGDDALEFEGKNMEIDCYRNFVKNAFRGIAMVPSSIGPAYFHENIITADRMADKYDNDALTPNMDPIDRYQELRTLKIGGTCSSAAAAENNTNNCLSTNSHFYYNTFAIKGAAMNNDFFPSSTWMNNTESSFLNNILYSSDGPCTDGTGDNCKGVVLRGNLFYTEKEPNEWTEWLQYRPNTTTKYRYWGGSGTGFTGNDINAVDATRATLSCLNEDIQWFNNEERAIDFVGEVGSGNSSDFFLTDINLNWNLEPLPDEFPLLVDENRTIPGALEGNDDCNHAIEILANPNETCFNNYSFTTSVASASTQSTCFSGADADDDVWFSFEALGTIQQINITNASQTMFFALYEGDCNNLTQVSCNGWDGSQSQDYVRVLTPGNTYHLRVYTSASGVTSDFDLCITTPEIPEDECETAVAILANADSSCDNSYSYSTTFASPSSEATCYGGDYADDDVWFSFNALATTHYFNITNASQTMFFELYEGNCNNLISFSCNGWNGYESLDYVSGLTIGNTYLFRIYTTLSGSYSDFDLCINTQSSGLKDDSTFSRKEVKPKMTNATLQVYPNPATNQCTIDYGQLDHPHSIQILDTKGSVLYQTSIDSMKEGQRKKLNLEAFPPGLLIIKVQDAQSTFISKLLHF